MGWTDSHLFEIAPGMWDGAGPIPTGLVLARSTRARLASGDVLNDIGTKTPRYLYDFLLSRSPPQHLQQHLASSARCMQAAPMPFVQPALLPISFYYRLSWIPFQGS